MTDVPDVPDEIESDAVRSLLIGMADRLAGTATAFGCSVDELARLFQSIGETARGSVHTSGGAAADNCGYTQRSHYRTQGLVNDATASLRDLASRI